MVLCLSVFVLRQGQVWTCLPRIRYCWKILRSLSDGNCQLSRSGEVSEGERVSLLATLGYIHVALSRSGLRVWMEVSKEAFRSGGVLADDDRSQWSWRVVRAGCHLYRAFNQPVLHFIRYRSRSDWSMKYYSRYFVNVGISNYVNETLLALIAFCLPKLPPEVSVKWYITTSP